jgi:hypothetical protein
MVLTRIALSISGEVLIEYLAGFDVGSINQVPSRNAAAASPADLPAKLSDDSILNAVVMRFNDSVVALVMSSSNCLFRMALRSL